MTNWPRRNPNRPWIYGHRGMRGMTPENTLLSFETAVAAGADGVELDVRFNHEGGIVVFHDETLERMTEGSDNRAVFDLSVRELMRVDLGQGAGIPTLSEVLDWARAGRSILNIEVKPRQSDGLTLASAVMQEILLRGDESLRSRILLSSFSSDVISQVVEQRWPHPFAMLVGPENPAMPERTGVRHQGVNPHYSVALQNQMADVRLAGMFANVWTVNDPSVARELDMLHVDGLITDAAGKIRDLFE